MKQGLRDWLIGAALLLTGLRWLTDPAGAAENLYMPLLDGAARSTQVGDLTAFFITGGILALAGVPCGMVLSATAAAPDVASILDDSGILGGLVVGVAGKEEERRLGLGDPEPVEELIARAGRAVAQGIVGVVGDEPDEKRGVHHAARRNAADAGGSGDHRVL